MASSDIDLDELQKLAERALAEAPGPRHIICDDEPDRTDCPGYGKVYALARVDGHDVYYEIHDDGHKRPKRGGHESAYLIEATSPDVILELISRIRKAEELADQNALLYIESSNPGIDMDEVRRMRNEGAEG